MNQICVVVVFCAVVSSAWAGWLKDLSSPQGLDFGTGVTIRLDNNTNDQNASLFEKHALRLDFGGVGVRVGKSPKKEAVEVGFFVSDKPEGRDKKMGEINVPFLIGFKLATAVTMTLGVMTALVVKALGVAKLALITSLMMLISKLMHGDEHHHQSAPAYVEIEHHPEHHVADYPATGGGYHPSGTANYYAYANYGPSAVAADNSLNYATVDTANSTSAAGSQQVAVVAKRRDFSRRKTYKVPVLTVHRYSVES